MAKPPTYTIEHFRFPNGKILYAARGPSGMYYVETPCFDPPLAGKTRRMFYPEGKVVYFEQKSDAMKACWLHHRTLHPKPVKIGETPFDPEAPLAST